MGELKTLRPCCGSCLGWKQFEEGVELCALKICEGTQRTFADCPTLHGVWGVEVSVLREAFISSLMVDKVRDRRISLDTGLIPSLPVFNLPDYTRCPGRSNPGILEFWNFSTGRVLFAHSRFFLFFFFSQWE